jgi:folate-dependent phosphoribosylglycinamide formyltransferase PurN
VAPSRQEWKPAPTVRMNLVRTADILRRGQAWRPAHANLLLTQLVGRRHNSLQGYSDADHLERAAAWLAEAQDVTGDGGVCGRFRLNGGWTSSYPETTGYIVPTFLALAREPGYGEFRGRAERAVEFLLRVQLPSGAFPGGELHENRTHPSVFNSAQIVSGLVAWHSATGDARALEAARRAGDWLVAVQDEDGAWRRHVYRDVATTYTAHASCWLAELGTVCGEERYVETARRHIAWVLGHVEPETGWIDLAGFDRAQHEARVAFTHTIAYAIWGLLHGAESCQDREGMAVAERAAWAVARRLELSKGLPGSLDWRWRRQADFVCLTGCVQMALIWARLYERGGDLRYLNAALNAIDQVKARQPMGGSGGFVGGIPGSDPVWGDYIPYAFPNWAAKYFVDALLAKQRLMRQLTETLATPTPAAPPAGRPMVFAKEQVTDSRPELRIVLYTRPYSARAAEICRALANVGIRPSAIIVERAPRQSLAARLAHRVSNDGIRTAAISRLARLRVRERPATEVVDTAATEDAVDVAVRLGASVVEVASLDGPEGVEAVAALDPDLAIHAGAGILRAPILAVPRIGTLNAHMGMLPRYRGMNVAEWSALEGGPIGCTVHFVDAGIDTGPILVSRAVDASAARSIRELRLLVNEAQLRALGEVVRSFAQGREPVAWTQHADEGRQYFRMHEELRQVLERRLAAKGTGALV